jgi:uncharacterized membrane protein
VGSYFSIRPTLTTRGREFHGIRGFAGKPTHPPLTDFPVAAYVLGMVFDVVSAIVSGDLGRDLYRAATFVLLAGAIVSLPTALTGFFDWWKSTPRGTQAWRTANWHMAVMLTVTVLVVINLVLRFSDYSAGGPPVSVLVLSVVVGLLVSFGAMFGGALVYEYGFNVETSGDHPAWHQSTTDVFPGEHGALDGSGQAS